jgi:hypothetical protein
MFKLIKMLLIKGYIKIIPKYNQCIGIKFEQLNVRIITLNAIKPSRAKKI